MTPQVGPSSKEPVSINFIQEAVADLPDETQICALVIPHGVQVQFFYDDYSLEKAVYSLGGELMDITHIVFQSEHIPQYAMASFIQDNCSHGIFDVSGVLYISFDSYMKINSFRAQQGQPTFRYVQSVVQFILNTGEFAEELRFTPNWSDTITALSCVSTYAEFLEILSQDFQIMDYLICTTKTVENVKKLKYDAVYIPRAKDISDFPARSIVLFNNDISKRNYLTPAESNVIAEVLIENDTDKIKIEAIEAEPNRFGRIRPVISSDEVTRYETEFYTIELKSMEDLAKAKYQVGDIVEIEFINKVPRLGRIVERSRYPKPSPLINEYCSSCGKNLVFKSGHLYCEGEHCPSSVLDKILYARSKRVLDLPFDWHAVHDLVMLKECVFNIPSLFNLDRSTLMTLYDTDVVDFVLRTLRVRTAQLNGDGFSPTVQNVAQGRFLDALSIVGLHQQNIKRLRQSLAKGDWQWPELPFVLTDRKILRSFKIPRMDTEEIIKSASSRLTELDSLVREL